MHYEKSGGDALNSLHVERVREMKGRLPLCLRLRQHRSPAQSAVPTTIAHQHTREDN